MAIRSSLTTNLTSRFAGGPGAAGRLDLAAGDGDQAGRNGGSGVVLRRSGRCPFASDHDHELAATPLVGKGGIEQPPWRIEQNTPLPCTLLSATTEVKVDS